MPFSNALELEERLAKVAELHRDGCSVAEIATQLERSKSQIGRDLNELFKRWRQSQLNDTNAALLEELAVTDWVENEARQAWLRSCENAEKEVTKTGKKDADGNGFELEVSTTVEGQYGDPRFLQVISNCSKDRRDMRGVDAPKKKDESGESALAALLVSEVLKGRDLAKSATNG